MGVERKAVPIIPALTGVRAYAIAGVVLIHLLLVSGVVARTEGTILNTAIWGLLGNVIDIFFIVSGFVLFLPIVVRGGDLGGLGRFAIGRAARLLPAYWLCLLLLLALIAFAPPIAAFAFPSLPDILINFAALQTPARMVDPTLAPGFGLDAALWMISVIVGFYVVLPLIARPFFRHPLLGLALAAAVTLGWKELAAHTGVFEAIVGSDWPRWSVQLIAINQLPGWAFSFALGMTGAWAYVTVLERWPREQLTRRATQALPAAILVYLLFAYMFGKTGETASGVITGSLARSDSLEALGSSASRAVLIAVIAIGPAWLQRPFANRPAFALAELSYGLYLIHIVVIIYATTELGPSTAGDLPAFAAWCGVVLPVSLLYAYASNRWVEQPVRKWARRRDRGRPGTASTEQLEGGAFHPPPAAAPRPARSP